MTDDSAAFWARVLLVPFPVWFLDGKIAACAPSWSRTPPTKTAILAWLVAGAVRLFHGGLTAPTPVTDATREYERESDPLADFLAEAVNLNPAGAEEEASELYGHYKR